MMRSSQSYKEEFELVTSDSPDKFKENLNRKFQQGWEPIPDSHVACWKSVAVSVGEGYSTKERVSKSGYFAMCVKRSVPTD
jgi:hypothetical protein